MSINYYAIYMRPQRTERLFISGRGSKISKGYSMDDITLIALVTPLVAIALLFLFKRRFRRKKGSHNDYLIDSFL